MKIVNNIRASAIKVLKRMTRQANRQSMTRALIALIVTSLLVSIVLPVTSAFADRTLTWTTNADFSFNKSSACQDITMGGIAIEGAEYSDETCASADSEASLKLADTYLPMHDVIDVVSVWSNTYVLKQDGSVWAWGTNESGQLGNGTYSSNMTPQRVKDSSGTGFLSGIIAITAGDWGTCYALSSDGTIWAWGDNYDGQLGNGTTDDNPLPTKVQNSEGTGPLTSVKEISANGGTLLILKTDSTLWGIGYNYEGELGDGTSESRSLPVQVRNATNTGYLENIEMVRMHAYHALALDNDGALWAWGANWSGQLGNGTYDDASLPTRVLDESGVGALSGVESIATGQSDSSFIIKSDGSLWAWGDNYYGNLGIGSTSDQLLPAQVSNTDGDGHLLNVVQVSSSYSGATVLLQDGSILGWGRNTYGEVGDGSTVHRTRPVAVKADADGALLSDITKLAGGSNKVFAVTSGAELLGWGDNTTGGISVLAPIEITKYPITVNADGEKKLRTGFSNVLFTASTGVGLKTDGTVWTWGHGYSGELGTGGPSEEERITPMQVKDGTGTGYLEGITAIATGYQHVVALKSDGTVWAWGSNSNGQLGVNSTQNQSLPVQVKDSSGSSFLTGASSIAAGASTAFALKSDGSVFAWGANNYGQLGDATSTQRQLPVQVKGAGGIGFLSGVSAISSGSGSGSCYALKSDGTVWSWGYNNTGQLGDDTTSNRTSPVQVKGVGGVGVLSDIVKISAGEGYVFAIKSDDTLWAWGMNTNGQLGDGTTLSRQTVVQVLDSTGLGFLTDVSTVSAGVNTSFAVMNDGTAWSWGSNLMGNLGNGTYGGQPLTLPGKMSGLGTDSQLSNVATIAPGGFYSAAAILTDSTLVTWGQNVFKQLAFSTPINNLIVPDTPSYYAPLSTGYALRGSALNYQVDAGEGYRTQWAGIDWNTDPLPNGTAVSFNVRTSDDGSQWSPWSSSVSQTTPGSTQGSGTWNTVAYSRYLDIRVTLTSDYTATPVLHDFSLRYANDTVAPSGSGAVSMKSGVSGPSVQPNGWTNTSQPYFSWEAATDNVDGTGVQGYCLYLGQDADADVTATKGLLGASQRDTLGKCQYAVTSTDLDTSIHPLSSLLSSSETPYVFLVKAIDNTGNVSTSPAQAFSFRYDDTAPTPPAFISAPAQFVSSKGVTMTWQTTGAQSASDTQSGIAGLQYRIGNTGTWYGDSHTGTQDITDILSNDGSYTLDPTHDYPLIQEGVNTVYFRSVDSAGNVSTTYSTASIKLNTSAPSSPQSVEASPSSNTINAFSFSWDAPAVFTGNQSGLSYCYTVNTLPTPQTCTYTTSNSLATDAFATQPGDNTFYVVARDEAGNINYSTAESTTFTANTAAPGIPTSIELGDISTKALATWKLALSWAEPEEVGSGVAKYNVYRSTDGTTFGQIAATAGSSYVDSSLQQQPYYYKVRACDSANNCGAFSQVISMIPTGRFTSPAELVLSPSAEVSARKAVIRWVTDRTSHSQVQFGKEPGVYFPSEIANNEQTKDHSIELVNLDAGTTYYYRSLWTDEDGNTGYSSEQSFTTLPAPTIKNVSVPQRTLNSATIEFTSLNATKVAIMYGKTESFGSVQSLNTSPSESTYRVELSGLTDNTTYYYKFVTTDVDGSVYSGNQSESFITPEQPRISNLKLQPVAGEPTSTQEVSWSTNVDTNSVVTYGKSGAVSKDSVSSTMTKNHKIVLRGLEDDSTYYLFANSRDAGGNLATSERQVFKTALDTRSPKVSGQKVTTSTKGNGADARGQIIVSWKTDEPSTSQVSYVIGSSSDGYTNTTSEDMRLTTDHVVVISDLSVSSVYHIQPLSRDKSQNAGKGDDQAAIIGRASESVLTVIFNSLFRIFGL